MIPKTVGRYRVIRQIGSGGMGEVHLAEDPQLQRQVALKILSGSDAKAKHRFVREAITASKLSHPNVAVVYEAGEADGLGFIAMQYVEGETLRDRLLRGPLAIVEIERIAREVADALDDAHRHGIVHRDIKPGNIMIDMRGHAKVLDFGIAKLTELDSLATPEGATAVADTTVGKFVGTLQYVSPEQARGGVVDGRSDIFSFGTVLYEMVTGENPFATSSFLETVSRIRDTSPRPIQRADCPEELKRIIVKCLEKVPDRRYQSARDLVLDLEGVGTVSTRRSGRLKPGLTLSAIVAVLVITFGVWYLRPKSGAVSAERVRSLAVLPFRPLGGTSGDDFLAVGMADAVIMRLAQVHSFIVRPTSSVVKYTSAAVDPIAAGREQRVDSIVDGHLQHVGNRIRVSVQLIRVSDGSSIWSGHFDERFSDVFDVQDAISQRVATALVDSLTGEERKGLTRRDTENIAAYQLYLRGRYFWERRNADSLRKSVSYYQQAIANDPSYALAYAGLADSYNMLGAFSVLSPNEVYPKAKDASARALQIEPGLAQAEVAKAYAGYLYDHDWNAAEAGFKHALTQDPNYGPGHQWYAVCLASRGRFEEARREIRRAVEVDPLSLIINSVVAWIEYLGRNPEGSVTQARRMIEIDPAFAPAHLYLAEAYADLGQYDDAFAEFQKAGGLLGTTHMGYACFVLAKAGHTTEARALLAKIEDLSRHQYVSSYHEALARLGLGEKEEAITLLEKAVDQHYPWVIHYGVEPVLDSLRDEPRFKELLHRIGLPESGPIDKVSARGYKTQVQSRGSVTVLSEERVRFARDLHHGILQSLTGTAMHLQRLRDLIARDPDAARMSLQKVQEAIIEDQQEVRSYVDRLRSAVLIDEHPLLSMRLQAVAERVQMERGTVVRVDVSPIVEMMSPGMAEEAYRVIREAVMNAASHAEAKCINVDVSIIDDQVRIVVEDDGHGFPFMGRYDLHQLTLQRRGPVTLKERIWALMGNMVIDSRPTGARLEIDLPTSLAKVPM